MTESYPTHKSEGAVGAGPVDQPRGIDDPPGRLVAADRPEQIFEYAPAPESRSIVHLRSSYGLFIDGAFVEPVDGNAYKTENPATEEVLAEIAAAGLEDVDRAVEAAGRAQKRSEERSVGKEGRSR